MAQRWPVGRGDQVRMYLAAAPDAACPGCGYCLRGLRDPVCPECGLQLSVSMLTGRRRWELPAPGVCALVAINVGLALAVMASAVLHGGTLPRLAWLAPAVLGAFACSVAYWPVFLRMVDRGVEMPRPFVGTAWVVAVVQGAGLVVMWA